MKLHNAILKYQSIELTTIRYNHFMRLAPRDQRGVPYQTGLALTLIPHRCAFDNYALNAPFNNYFLGALAKRSPFFTSENAHYFTRSCIIGPTPVTLAKVKNMCNTLRSYHSYLFKPFCPGFAFSPKHLFWCFNFCKMATIAFGKYF